MMSRGMVRCTVVAALLVMVFAAAPLAWAQAPAPVPAPTVKLEDVGGTWEGVSKGTNGDVPVKVELLAAGGKITGTIGTQTMVVSVTDGKLEGDVLTFVLDAQGMPGTMTGKVVAAGKIEGTWQVSSESGSFSITKAAATVPTLAGEWVGEAQVQGQPMPITLFIKVEGDTVSGEIQSPMGRVAFTSAGYKDGLLSLSFPYAGGEPVTMGAKFQDGRLVGVFDYNSGEGQGTWWAAKK